MNVLQFEPRNHVIVPAAIACFVGALVYKAGALDYPFLLFWIVAPICALGAVLTPVMVYHAWKRARRLDDVPRSRIRSAALGYVELHGRVRPLGEPLLGPLSGRPCVWYRTRRYRRRKHGNESPPDGHAPHGTADRTFVIADATGACLVAPLGADVDTERRTRAACFEEFRIEPGDHLYVIGELTDAGYLGWTAGAVQRGDAALALRGRRSQQAIDQGAIGAEQAQDDVSDERAPRAAAFGEVIREQNAQARSSHWLVMGKSMDASLPFAVSTRVESGVLQRYRQHVALGLLGSVASALLFIAALWTYPQG